MTKILTGLAVLFGTWLLWLVLSQYFFCTRFAFNQPAPFEGPRIYNPYDSVKTDQWIKCNFHAHAHAWNGVTNGHGNAAQVHQAYDSLHYGVHCVSNYHEIDTTLSGRSNYISAYEHGYNLRKTHQLVLGSHEVKWLDYLLPQTEHNKQHVLNHLKADPDALVILNHPGMRNGYTEEDLSMLGNYDCMEVLNPASTSEKQWDAALSAGKKAFIVGDDDLHNVIDKERFGVICTFVNAKSNGAKDVLKALKSGNSYGVKIGNDQNPFAIPQLQQLTVVGDSIYVQMNEPAGEIRLIGQNGRILTSFTNTSSAKYKFRKDDHYARVVAEYANGTRILLNPVFYTPTHGHREAPVYQNINETFFYRSLGITISALWLLLLWRFLPGNKGFGGAGNARILFPWQKSLRRRKSLQPANRNI